MTDGSTLLEWALARPGVARRASIGSGMSIVENRKAFHDYFIEERVEAGLALEGWEVKAIRAGRAQPKEAYVVVKSGEIVLIGAHISPLHDGVHARARRPHAHAQAAAASRGDQPAGGQGRARRLYADAARPALRRAAGSSSRSAWPRARSSTTSATRSRSASGAASSSVCCATGQGRAGRPRRRHFDGSGNPRGLRARPCAQRRWPRTAHARQLPRTQCADLPAQLAVRHGRLAYTYSEFAARSRRLASALARRGIARGDTVAVMAPNVPALLEAHYAVPALGAVLNALNVRLDAPAIASRCNMATRKCSSPTPNSRR